MVTKDFSLFNLCGDKPNIPSYGEIEIPKNCIAIELNEVVEIIQIDKKITYRSVKEIIKRKKKISKKLELFDQNDNCLKDDELVINSLGTLIIAKLLDLPFSVEIHHLDQIFSVEKMNQNTSIREVQRLLELEQHICIDTFSHKGKRLSLNDKFLEKNIVSNDVLVSKIKITVTDSSCNSVEELDSYDFWTLETLIKNFCNSQCREFHKTSKVIFNNKVLQVKDITLYELQIRNHSRLQYFVPPFKITIQDNENLTKTRENITLEIQDNWDINQLMVSYSRKTSKPFMDEDKIMLNGHILEGGISVWRLRIKPGTKLIIGREMKVRILSYLCSDCGMEVLLKSQDTVQCRSCFGKILFKKRTRRACQYDCR